jgi:hypothetical protein
MHKKERREAMRRLLLVVFALFWSFGATGCAAVFNNTMDTVNITSVPSGASVFVNRFPRGKTPAKVRLSVKQNHDVEVRMPGYQSTSASIVSKVGAGWIVLDIIIGGVVSLLVDAATGAWKELDRNAVHFTLVANPK